MRELTGKPKTNTGYANLNTNEIHLATIYTLDDIGDGATYSRVLTTDITAGHIKLSETIQSASYRTVNDTEKGVWNGKPDDMDELGEGVTYKKVLATQISSGRISLTAANYYSGKFSGEWYSMGTESGVDIDAVTGINIYGKGNALTTRATKTGTIQCYVGTDGAIYAGAGKVKLDAGGVEIIGEFLQVSNPLEDATHWIGAEVNAFARDKDGNVLPCLSDASLIYTGGAWVQRQPAFSFKQWLALAGEIDPYSDTAATLYFITKNKARDANLDHIFAPSVTSHGRLGNATYKWLSAHIDTITPVTIDFPTTDVTDCLDEDDMASDSATKLATQQSIKAYADNTHRRITENYHSFWFNSHWFSGLLYEGWKTGSGLVSWDTNGAYVLQDTGATLNSYIRIVKENGANIYPNQWGASIIEFFWKGYFDSTTNQKIHIVLGHINDPTSSDNKVHHIGFKILDGILYGTVGDGANVTEATLQIDAAISASTVYTLRCKYTPTGVAEVRFWWMKGTDSAWTDAGTITTSLPSGGSYAEKMFNSAIYNTNAVSHKLYTNEVKSFVQGLYTGG